MLKIPLKNNLELKNKSYNLHTPILGRLFNILCLSFSCTSIISVWHWITGVFNCDICIVAHFLMNSMISNSFLLYKKEKKTIFIYKNAKINIFFILRNFYITQKDARLLIFHKVSKIFVIYHIEELKYMKENFSVIYRKSTNI